MVTTVSHDLVGQCESYDLGQGRGREDISFLDSVFCGLSVCSISPTRGGRLYLGLGSSLTATLILLCSSCLRFPIVIK
jgi:hypothetical protein